MTDNLALHIQSKELNMEHLETGTMMLLPPFVLMVML